MAKESYFLFTVWGVLGFVFFRLVIGRDKLRRYGNSIAVWVGMMALVIFSALMWIGEATTAAAEEAIGDMHKVYSEIYAGGNVEGVEALEQSFVKNETAKMDRITTRNNIVVLGLFALSVTVIVSNHRTMKRRERENEEALGDIRNIAYKDNLTGVKSMHAYSEKEKSMNVRISDELVDEFAVVVCDVNGLKVINDTLGHKTGDEYIRKACDIICSKFKRSPVFRIGGDEFVVILEGSDYNERSNLMRELDELADVNNVTGGVVVAAGITDYEKGIDMSFRKVFDRADAMMYARKRELKGAVAEASDGEDPEESHDPDKET